jgi:hypothetical protein
MILTGDYLYRRREKGLNPWVLGGHAVLTGLLTLVGLLLPWFVAHGAAIPPARPLVIAILAAIGAALLIVIVVNGFGVARLRLITSSVLVVLLLFFYGIGPFVIIPAWARTKRVIQTLDKTYSARPLAEKLADYAPAAGTVAVFQVRRDVEYGLSFYRNREVANYEETGVPAEQHLLVARVTGSRGKDLHTTAMLEEYLEDRHYEPLFSWPEQGLEVYLVGAANPLTNTTPAIDKTPATPQNQKPDLHLAKP